MAIVIIFNTTDRPVEVRLFRILEQNIWNIRASTGLVSGIEDDYRYDDDGDFWRRAGF